MKILEGRERRALSSSRYPKLDFPFASDTLGDSEMAHRRLGRFWSIPTHAGRHRETLATTHVLASSEFCPDGRPTKHSSWAGS